MSTMQSVLIIISLIQSIHSQQSVHYVPDQDFIEYSNPLTNGVTTIKVAYPLRTCTKVGSQLNYALYSLFQCSSGGSYVNGPCKWSGPNAKSLCSVGTCNSGDATQVFGSECADLASAATRTKTYVEISYYCGSFIDDEFPTDCPNNNATFTEHGFVRLATNICTDQGTGGPYFMATCNNVSAEIGIYSNPGCTTKTGTHTNYSRSCQKYAHPNGISCRYFRRVTACVIDDSNILADTLEPTSVPSNQPSNIPTNNPSTIPTHNPTQNPSLDTSNPTNDPTQEPTKDPTQEPTHMPTVMPTNNPTTLHPTNVPSGSPTQNLDPDVTVFDTQELLAGLNNLSLIYIAFAVLFILYLFICFYIWFNERRNRRILTKNFQNEDDKEARKEYMRQRNLQRKLELQGVNPKQAQNMAANANYQQMNEQHANQRKIQPRDHQLMSEGR